MRRGSRNIVLAVSVLSHSTHRALAPRPVDWPNASWTVWTKLGGTVQPGLGTVCASHAMPVRPAGQAVWSLSTQWLGF
jgi:hypothetical protein